MARVQLALNVSDIGAAVDFYSALFRTGPAKVRPGYANFAVDDPPLKLVLIENPGAEPGSLNHLGIEVDSADKVRDAGEHLAHAGLTLRSEDNVECCHALQTKIWVDAPGQRPWEIYTVLGDIDADGAGSDDETDVGDISPCCADLANLVTLRR